MYSRIKCINLGLRLHTQKLRESTQRYRICALARRDLTATLTPQGELVGSFHRILPRGTT